jgi:hypothetical protein
MGHSHNQIQEGTIVRMAYFCLENGNTHLFIFSRLKDMSKDPR